MQTLILSLHVIVCVTLVILVLLQAGKEGMGVIFGGGNASVFGSSGAGGLLAKMTAFMAVLFIVTSLSYNYVSSSHKAQESTILDVRLEDTPKPAAPAATVSASLTTFRQPGRGMISQYITRHTGGFPPAVGVGVLDDPFLRPPPALRRCA